MPVAICEVLAKTAEAVGTAVKEAAELSAHAAEHMAEAAEAEFDEIQLERAVILKPDLAVIQEFSLRSLMTANAEGASPSVTEGQIFGEVRAPLDAGRETSPTLERPKPPVLCENPSELGSVETPGLTEEQKALIIRETGWSKEIVDCIESMDQYEIYKNADLHEAEIDGRKCLIKDIDMDYVDPKTGMTNRELLEKGRAPIDAKTGERIELHHMGQDFDSPLAELCSNSEHGDGKDAVLHDKKVESWRRDPEKKNEYNNVQRPNHWKARAQEG